MRCPRCGSELRRGLKFCHKCGAVIDNIETANNNVNTNVKRKNPSCLMVLAVFTGILLLIGIIGSKSVSQSENQRNDSKNNITEEVVRYHNNQGINNLITEYNVISEVKISQSIVRNGAYDTSASISVNGVWVQIYNSSAGMFIDYSSESESDDNIYVLFRDFSKVLNSSLTDENIENAWEELRTEKYENYTKYDIGGIQATYSTEKLNNGSTRYLVKTGLNN